MGGSRRAAMNDALDNQFWSGIFFFIDFVYEWGMDNIKGNFLCEDFPKFFA